MYKNIVELTGVAENIEHKKTTDFIALTIGVPSPCDIFNLTYFEVIYDFYSQNSKELKEKMTINVVGKLTKISWITPSLYEREKVVIVADKIEIINDEK